VWSASDRRHVDIEARQDLRVQSALELAERVGDALLERAVVDRGAAAGLRELVLDALSQLSQLGAQGLRSSSAQRSSWSSSSSGSLRRSR
jgi:hypothetical protein